MFFRPVRPSPEGGPEDDCCPGFNTTPWLIQRASANPYGLAAHVLGEELGIADAVTGRGQNILWCRKKFNAKQGTMAKINDLTGDFLEAIKEIEIVLLDLLFERQSFLEKGLAYFIDYKKKNNTRVEFLFGPSDWAIEVIIYTSKGKFAFRDLLGIPEINRWVNNNRYKQENGRNLKNELEWFVDLLKVSLPYVE